MRPITWTALVTLLVVWGVMTLLVRRRDRRAAKSLAEGLLTLRRLQNDETAYVPRRPADAVASEAQAAFDAGLADLSAQHMAMLGDFMERRGDRSLHGPLRWFVDPDRTTCGWFAVLPARKGPVPIMTLFSESSSGAFFYTGRGASSPALAHPPNLTRTMVEWHKGLAAALEQHHASMRAAGGADSLRKVASADDAMAMLQRLRANTRTWRAKQDPKALITADARGILGNHYERLGPAVVLLVNAVVESREASE